MTSMRVVDAAAPASSPLVALMTPATAPLLTRGAFADGRPDPITAMALPALDLPFCIGKGDAVLL